MTPLQRAIAVSILTAATMAVPGAAPVVMGLKAAAPIAYKLSPAVIDRLTTSRLVDLPLESRAVNWQGPKRQGSCVWASLTNLLRWQGRHDAAEWVRKTQGDGANNIYDVAPLFDRNQWDYALGRSGDEKFLEWACRTRRGACVPVENGAHEVCLVGFDSQFAHILDNNNPDRQSIKKIPRAEFLRDWKASGGDAFTPLMGAPAPPKPFLVLEPKDVSK